MSSIKPSLSEVLHYPAESRQQLMLGFADAVDRIASNNQRTDIEIWQIVHALNEPNVYAVLALKSQGLPIYRCGTFRIDCRDFRKWATSWTPYRSKQTKKNTYKEGTLI